MPIRVNPYAEDGLTIFTVTGQVSFDEFMAEMKAFYDGEPTMNVLWDLSNASVWDLTVDNIRTLSQYAPRIKKSTIEARTAIVAADEITFSMSKLFIQFGQSKGLKRRIEIFFSLDEAIRWIGDRLENLGFDYATQKKDET